MLQLFRRHRQRLGRTLAGLLALGWMTLALQPCAHAEASIAHSSPDTHAVHATVEHHGEMHGEHAMHAVAMGEPESHEMPCAPGEKCPVFKAVDNQAAPKAADPLQASIHTAPALFASFPIPALPIVREAFDRRVAFTFVPTPPILEFRVLRI